MKTTRREVLTGAGMVVVTSLAGCVGNGSPSGNTTTPAPTPTPSPTPVKPVQVAKLAAWDGGPEDRFGHAVALSGDGTTALLGAPLDENLNGPNSGSAYVFTREGDEWGPAGKLAAADGDVGDQFGAAVALSADGTVALVGAPRDEDPLDSDYGSAYLFALEGGEWRQTAKLVTRTGGPLLERFGWSVALSADGTRAIVGAPSGGPEHNGAASIFSLSGMEWSLEGFLTPTRRGLADNWGRSVALSNDGRSALVGAFPRSRLNDFTPGFVAVYTRDGDVWSQVHTLEPLSSDTPGGFGWTVALAGDGESLLVGAPAETTSNDALAGAGHVFTRSGSDWVRGERLVATDGARNDEFSYAVALSDDGTVALVGARRDDNPRGIEAGGAYMYSRVDGAWTRQVKLLPADGDDGDIFGWSAALSGDGRTVLVGAPLDEDPEGENGGSAYVFDRW